MFKLQIKIGLILTTVFSILADTLPARPTLIESERYIIVYKPNTKTSIIKNQIQLIRPHLVKNTTHSFQSIGSFKWFSGSFHPDTLRSLYNTSTDQVLYDNDKTSPVHYWVKDTIFSLQEFIQTDPPSWGLDRIDQRTGTDGEYKFANSQGKGVTIYLMDSGINPNHRDIAGRVKIGKTVVGDLNDPYDHNGHGTFVAGVCCGTHYGVAKGAEIVSVKTLDDKGNGHLSDLLVGLQWIVEQHVSDPNAKSIVNLSLGAFYSHATNKAIEEAMALGIHFVIAAGNYGEDACLFSPGSTPGAVTVGAIDEDDSVSYYSNFGKCVDIFAPGTNIKSIWPTSNKATRTLTGTSMAAPHVAGTMAIFLSQRDYTPPQLRRYIQKVSSLITEDFIINNTAPFYSENKTVVDNGIHTGYKVKGRQDGLTPVNILFSHPKDDQAFWIFGGSIASLSFQLQPNILFAFLFIIFHLFLI